MTNIKKIIRQKKRFRNIQAISYITFAALILSSVYMLHMKLSAQESLKNFKNNTILNSRQKQIYLDNFLSRSSNLIKAISSNNEFISFAKKGMDKKAVINLFRSIIKTDKNYMQLRYINRDGKEVIRFDQTNAVSIVKQQKNLQNKSKRYYCKKCATLHKDEIWYSNIDLNIEHGEIQEPIKPVLRVSIPVFNKDKYLGFIILNIFMKHYLDDLTNSAIYDLYLCDLDGNFIISKNSKDDWSKYLNKKVNIMYKFGIKKDNFKKDTFFSKKGKYYIKTLKISGSNNLKLIYFENQKQKLVNENLMKKRVVITVLFAMFISFPFSYLISLPIAKIYDSLEKEAEDLARETKNLEVKVKEEIDKNRAKDKLLENQAKLAALGEMIGNIAHQWRHPITRLSLIIQNLKSFYDADKMNNQIFNRYYKSSLEQIDYMSNTIEDFRNFYKEDNEKSLFDPSVAIANACNIINASIKHEGIMLHIHVEDRFKIMGFANQFSQVILNVLQNAKDAFEDNATKEPCIDISLYKKDYKCFIDIKDNAGGIDKQIIGKIFDAYVTTKKNRGTGVGLYMSKTIIEENFNGHLNAKNIQDGAIFTIKIDESSKTDLTHYKVSSKI